MATFFQQLVNGIAWGTVYALIALGYTMVYGVLRMINFAHGDVVMVGAMLGLAVANFIAARTGIVLGDGSLAAFAVVMPVAMIACAAAGIIIEQAAYKPLRHAPKIAVLITAIGVSFLLEYGGQAVVGATPHLFPKLVGQGNFVNIGDGRFVIANIDVITVVVSLALMGFLQWIVFRTRIGTAMRAVAFNHDAARLMGIHVDGIITFTFGLGSALAGAAGILMAVKIQKVEPLMGLMPGLKAFVAAVLGGIGNIPGAVVGGLVLGVAETLVAGYVSSTYKDAIAFVVLIGILLFKPTGLFGRVAAEKV